jgi:methionine salvage enolase-phosphatase E1
MCEFDNHSLIVRFLDGTFLSSHSPLTQGSLKNNSTAEKIQQDVIASIGWQMKADRKIGALKAFQGYMWREGYASGDLKGA